MSTTALRSISSTSHGGLGGAILICPVRGSSIAGVSKRAVGRERRRSCLFPEVSECESLNKVVGNANKLVEMGRLLDAPHTLGDMSTGSSGLCDLELIRTSNPAEKSFESTTISAIM